MPQVPANMIFDRAFAVVDLQRNRILTLTDSEQRANEYASEYRAQGRNVSVLKSA